MPATAAAPSSVSRSRIAPQREGRRQERELAGIRRAEVVDRRAEADEILEQHEMLGRVVGIGIVESGRLRARPDPAARLPAWVVRP